MRVHPCSPRLECFNIKEEAGFQQQTNISGLTHLPLKIAIKEKSIRIVCVEGKPCRRKGKAYASSRLRRIGWRKRSSRSLADEQTLALYFGNLDRGDLKWTVVSSGNGNRLVQDRGCEEIRENSEILGWKPAQKSDTGCFLAGTPK